MLLQVPAWGLAVATNPPPGKIPPLRPPREALGPTFWEQHGRKVLAGAAAGLLCCAGLLWWLRRPGPVVNEPAERAARRALEALRGQTEEPALVAAVAQALRHYIQAVLRLPNEEWTNDELLAALNRGGTVEADVATAVGQVLRECEARAFAPLPPPAQPALVDRAIEAAARLEQKPAGA
jgi:hypothetical protein